MDTTLTADSTETEAAVEVMEQVVEGMTLSKVLYGILLLAICVAVVKVVTLLADRTMRRLKVEPTVHKFARSSLEVLLWLAAAVVMASYLGLPVNSMVALVGVVGVALSLSLQGSLLGRWPVKQQVVSLFTLRLLPCRFKILVSAIAMAGSYLIVVYPAGQVNGNRTFVFSKIGLAFLVGPCIIEDRENN